MANRVGPADAVAGAPSYTGRMLRQLGAVNLAGSTSADPLGAHSGVRPGTPSSTVSVTTTQWTVGNHSGVIDVAPSLQAGPYTYSIDAPVVGTLTAATSFIRIDILSLTLTDPAESVGSGTPGVAITYTVGTVASTQPATPAYSMLLAVITTPASGGGGPTVQWVAPYSVASGAPIPVRSQAERDALSAHLGLQVKRLDLNGCPVETYNGTAFGGGGARFGARVQTNVAQTAAGSTVVVANNGGTAAWTTIDNIGGFATGVGGTATPIVIPAGAGGMYLVGLAIVMTAISTTRGFADILINGSNGGTGPGGATGIGGARVVFTGDTNGAVSAPFLLNAGDTVGVQVFNNIAGNLSAGAQVYAYRLSN